MKNKTSYQRQNSCAHIIYVVIKFICNGTLQSVDATLYPRRIHVRLQVRSYNQGLITRIQKEV